MCLILFAVSPNKHDSLIVAANRDEQHKRPTLPANYWEADKNVIGGIDLQAGGTWLGISSAGRFAAVTNYAELPRDPLPPRSRGALTSNFLQSNIDPLQYLKQVDQEADQYRGFNLILSSGGSTWYYSNRSREMKALTPGFYGLSNQLLDCDWPKVISAREELISLSHTDFETEGLFDLLAHQGDGTDHSARFIIGENYGTSVCTVVRLSAKNHYFEERSFDQTGRKKDSRIFRQDTPF
ncbi:MAG: hypothetical protein ACI9FB_002927 [Candidatus Azotimanducaceae bacterium]|jgi:uncharacterized protein with NRDE domain